MIRIDLKSASLNLYYQTISSIKSTLRKITIDNCVKYVSKDSNSQSEYSLKDSKAETASLPKQQNRKLSQNNKTFTKNITREGFRMDE